MEKPCAAKVDLELGGVATVINRKKSNKSNKYLFCAKILESKKRRFVV